MTARKQPSAVSLDSEAFEEDSKLDNEQYLVDSRLGLGGMPDVVLEDFGFAINRLHDPCNYDHTTIENMLARYHFRDLGKSKLFRLAKKIFGDKMEAKFRIRTRTFNLSGMDKGYPGKLIRSSLV